MDSEYQAGAIRHDTGNESYELHVSGGSCAAVIQLESEEVPLPKGEKQELLAGQIPAPAIKLLQKGASVENASKESIEIWDADDDADVTFGRDAQLVEDPQNVWHLIPTGDGDTDPRSICIDAKRLKDLSEALACDKLVLTIHGDGDPIRVDPIKGNHVGVIRQAERPHIEVSGDEITESMLEDEVPPEDDPDKMLIED